MKPTSMRQVRQKLSAMYPAKRPMKQLAPRPQPQLTRPKVSRPVRRRLI